MNISVSLHKNSQFPSEGKASTMLLLLSITTSVTTTTLFTLYTINNTSQQIN